MSRVLYMYPFKSLTEIKQYIPQMEKLKVSEVARGKGGFLHEYMKVGGDHNKLSTFWKEKRIGFIKRTLASYKLKPTYRRLLSLYAWAYNPHNK